MCKKNCLQEVAIGIIGRLLEYLGAEYLLVFLKDDCSLENWNFSCLLRQDRDLFDIAVFTKIEIQKHRFLKTLQILIKA